MTRPGRPRKEEESDRRERLLEQAVRLFGEHGYGGLSLESFARESRVSLRTVYSQFGGKAGLFSAVVRQCSDRLAAALPLDAGHTTPLETTLIDFAREYLYRMTRPEIIRLRAQIMAEAPRFPQLASDFYCQGPGRTLNHLARFFEQRQREGKLDPGYDSHFLAGQFLNTLRGERFQRLQLGIDPVPATLEIEAHASDAVRLFLHGCGHPARRPKLP